MNTTPSHFLVYDDLEQTWKPTSLEELSIRNDPDLYIIPVYENEKQGKQCTWKEFEGSDRKKQWGAPKRPAQRPQTSTAANAQATGETQAASTVDNPGLTRAINSLRSTVEPTCSLVRFTCRFFVVVFCLNCIFAGLAVGSLAFKEQPLGLVIGAALGVASIFLVRVIVSTWSEADKD